MNLWERFSTLVAGWTCRMARTGHRDADEIFCDRMSMAVMAMRWMGAYVDSSGSEGQ